MTWPPKTHRSNTSGGIWKTRGITFFFPLTKCLEKSHGFFKRRTAPVCIAPGECLTFKYSTIGSCILGGHLHVPRCRAGTAGGFVRDEVTRWHRNKRTHMTTHNNKIYIGFFFETNEFRICFFNCNLEDELLFWGGFTTDAMFGRYLD